MQGNDPINFAALNKALLGRIDTLCAQWLPGGKAEAGEYTVHSIWRSEKTASLRVRLSGERAGRWGDFGGSERGNDLASLYAAIHGLTAAQAAVQLAHEYGLEREANIKAPRPHGAQPPPPPPPPPPKPAEGRRRDDEGWQVMVPVPDWAPAPTYWHHHHKEIPEHVARYMRDGDLYGCVVRWRKSNGGKDTLPYTWCVSRRDGSGKWHWKTWDEPRPLYLPGGTSPQGRTVILVEGEKKADALHVLLEHGVPGVYCVASWPGGSKAWGKALWDWLAGCVCLLWPDCDGKREPLTRAEAAACVDDDAKALAQAAKPLLPEERQVGVMAMRGIGALLATKQGCTVHMLPIPAPGEVADGWDCGDAIAEGWDLARMLELFGRAQPVPGGEVGSSLEPVPAPKNEGLAGAGSNPPGGPGGGAGGEGVPSGGADAFEQYLDFVNPVRHEIGMNRKMVIGGLRRAPALAGVLGFNELTNAPCTRKPWPWRTQCGPLEERDDLRLGDWLSVVYRVKAASRAALSEAIDTVADEGRFHPIRDWLQGLKHDGRERLDKWLIHVLGLRPEAQPPKRRRYLELVGRFWLLGMVARVMNPGCKFDYSLVLEGKGGRGKSTFFRTLASSAHFSDTHFDLGQGKEGWEQLEGLWIYELSELTALRKADPEQAKQFFSSQVDRFRGAYGKYVQAHPRQCLIGCSTNKRQYLSDLSGNRRYWPVWVDGFLNTQWLADYREQLFAEALAAYRDGQRYVPTQDEEDELFVPEQRLRLAETSVQSRLMYLLTREGYTVADAKATQELSVLTSFVTLDQLTGVLGADPAKSTAHLEGQVRSWLEAHDWVAGREGAGLRRRGWRRPVVWPPAMDDDPGDDRPAEVGDQARSREPGDDDDLPL